MGLGVGLGLGAGLVALHVDLEHEDAEEGVVTGGDN